MTFHLTFQWMLGNYCQSIGRLVGCHPKLVIDESKILGDPYVFTDPEVGQYCVILSAKNGLRNCVGEAVSAKLSKLSFAMAAYALNKCGLPVSLLRALNTLCYWTLWISMYFLAFFSIILNVDHFRHSSA